MVHVAHTHSPSYTPARQARRRGLVRVGRMGAILVAVFGALVVLGLAFEALAEARDAQQYPPPGQLVPVGGHTMHIYCSGPNSALGTTVLLEAGPGANVLTWSLVQPAVAKFARVCSYDRAGLGWSAPGPQPRSSARIVDELHQLLEQAGVKPPYVLVGHSDGGAYSRVFAAQYPTEVSGLVLVDSRNAGRGQRSALGLEGRPLALLAQVGLVRLVDGPLAGPQTTALGRLPVEEQARAYALAVRPSAYETVQQEAAALAETDSALRQLSTMGDRPLVVITHGQPDPAYALPGEDQWRTQQADLLRFSTRSTPVLAATSGHNIQFDQPDLVVDAVRQIVGAVQR